MIVYKAPPAVKFFSLPQFNMQPRLQLVQPVQPKAPSRVLEEGRRSSVVMSSANYELNSIIDQLKNEILRSQKVFLKEMKELKVY